MQPALRRRQSGTEQESNKKGRDELDVARDIVTERKQKHLLLLCRGTTSSRRRSHAAVARVGKVTAGVVCEGLNASSESAHAEPQEAGGEDSRKNASTSNAAKNDKRSNQVGGRVAVCFTSR